MKHMNSPLHNGYRMTVLLKENFAKIKVVSWADSFTGFVFIRGPP